MAPWALLRCCYLKQVSAQPSQSTFLSMCFCRLGHCLIPLILTGTQETGDQLSQAGEGDCVGGRGKKMWTLTVNSSSVLTRHSKEHCRNMLLPENLMPLCCRLWESSLPDPPCWSAVHLVVLRSLVSVAQEKLRMSWEDRLLRHLTAKLQRYYTARMKCNISASLNVWHLDRSSAEALTLRLPFCNVLRPSSRMERRVCWVFFLK